MGYDCIGGIFSGDGDNCGKRSRGLSATPGACGVAGSGPDVLARALAAQLERQTGKPFVIDNRAGANGIIGAEIVARSAADGYSVMHASPGFLLNTLVYSKPSYDVQRDFVSVTNVASGSGYLLLVNPVLAVRSVADLMVLAKSPSLVRSRRPSL